MRIPAIPSPLLCKGGYQARAGFEAVARGGRYDALLHAFRAGPLGMKPFFAIA